jgi:hypothetical protein
VQAAILLFLFLSFFATCFFSCRHYLMREASSSLFSLAQRDLWERAGEDFCGISYPLPGLRLPERYREWEIQISEYSNTVQGFLFFERKAPIMKRPVD